MTAPTDDLFHESEEFCDEFFAAICRDTGNPYSKDARKRLKGELHSSCSRTTFKFVNGGAGVHSTACLVKWLTRPGVDVTVNRVNLHGNLIRDLGAKAVLKLLEAVPSITSLNIGCNDISHDGAIAIAHELKSNMTLRTLIVGSDSGGSHPNHLNEQVSPSPGADVGRGRAQSRCRF
jgi:hypothetical protein